MAGVKISSLTTSATFSDSDVLPVVSGGVTKKVTGAVVKAAIGVPPAGSVGTTQLANGSVTTPKLAAGAVDAAALGTSAVETAKINDSAVTTAKLADNNVTSAKLSTTLRADIVRGAQSRSGTTIPTTGSVKGVVVMAGGSGYTSGVTVSIAAPPSGVTATATATVASGVVTSITITDEGSGYVDQNPTVTITAVGAGSGASAVAYAMVNPLLEDDSKTTRNASYSFAVISSNDHVVVAGENPNYSNGTGTSSEDSFHPTPLQLTDSSGNRYKPVRLFSSGDSLYVLANDGSLWSCGFNGYGQLGRGFTGAPSTLAQNQSVLRKITFSGGGIVKKFATNCSTVSGATTCLALVETSSGQVLYGWGYNGYGQLGNGTDSNANTPQVISCSDGASTITDIMCVGRSSSGVCCVLFSSGRAKASGYNASAQLSRGNTSQPSSPTFEFVNVSAGTPLTNIVEIAGCDNATSLYFRTSAGLIYACGYNGYGELGNGNGTSTSTYMVQVTGGAVFPTGAGRFIYPSGRFGTGHFFAFKADGSLVGSGYNGYGELGDGTLDTRYSPVSVLGGFTTSNVTKLITLKHENASNTGASAILKTDGTIWVTGYNGTGGLGLGANTTTTNGSFTQIPFDKSIVKDIFFVSHVTTARPYLAILTNDGSVYTTGYNYSGAGLRGYGNTNFSTHVQGRI